MCLARKIIIVICVVPVAAAAVPLSVGAYYAPGFVLNGDIEGDPLDFSGVGFEGRFSWGVWRGVAAVASVGFHDYVYNTGEYVLFDVVGVGFVRAVPTLAFSGGCAFRPRLGPFEPYGGAGALLAVKRTPLYKEAVYKTVPGFYIGAGAAYYFSERWAVAAGPRYSYYFDDPITFYGLGRYERAGARTQLVDILMGVNYYW